MKNKIAIILIILFSYNYTFAQKTPFTGVVKLFSSGNKPLSEVEISNEWSTKLTNSEGKFQLIFVDRQIGDKINLNVYKTGYEIVNKEQSTTHLTGLKDYTHKIIMCPRGYITKSRIRYYNIAVNNITDNYNRKIKKLDKKNKDYKNQILQLQKDTTIAFKKARKFSKKYAEINLDDIDTTYRKILILYKEGKIDSALSILSFENLEKHKNQIKRQENKLKEAKINYAKECLIGAEISFTKLDFVSVEKYYKEAANIDTLNYIYNSKYASDSGALLDIDYKHLNTCNIIMILKE